MSLATEKEVKYLVHLLACAFNNKTPEYSEEIDYSALLSLAKNHQIYNIICSLINDMPQAPQAQKDEFRNYNLSEISKMIIVNNERGSIFNQLEKNGVRYMPLKGLIIKNYYPKESMRQMSDNDIYYDEKDKEKVYSIMKGSGYKIHETCSKSEDYYKEPHCRFEFHHELFFNGADFNPVFDGLWDRAVKDNNSDYLYHMGLDDVYIYSVCHMYKHYASAGCGIRFLADNYLFLRKENDNLNWDYITTFLGKYNLVDYELQSRNLAFKLFDEKELDNDDLELLETYINFGIYGNGKLRIKRKLDKLGGASSKRAKIKFIMYRLFPPKSELIFYNKFLKDKPYLIPFFYVYRLFRGLFKGKKSLNELDNIKKSK